MVRKIGSKNDNTAMRSGHVNPRPCRLSGMHAISNAYSGILSREVACPMMSRVVCRTASVSGDDHSKLLVGRLFGSTLVRMSAVNWK
eukprot:scaffold687833_cov94-Attheya_sp.AAC.1